jgi:hypothetical protein
MTELSDLPPWERAKRYRELAYDARRKAPQCAGGISVGNLAHTLRWKYANRLDSIGPAFVIFREAEHKFS